MWKSSNYQGGVIPFSPVLPEDDYLHPVLGDQHFSHVETNLYGFNIPEENIQCNIYVLWHPVFKCMSMHIFVYKGRRILTHQLQADYFNEHLYLPAVDDLKDYRIKLGSCDVRIQVVKPLEKIHLQYKDAKRDFNLDLICTAAMPVVGRPGGHHFTQLMKTNGELTLDGQTYQIDGHYMRDRSWGYSRPEEAEKTPPYRWMTGWLGDDQAFVVAWMDTGVLDGAEFGDDWHTVVQGSEASGQNKWESGGETPSLNLRSGWFAVEGEPLPVISMTVRTLFDTDNPLLVKAIELDITDANGGKHQVIGETMSMIPKMYWQNLLVHMHAMKITCGERQGHGDLMDTYSTYHMKKIISSGEK